MAELVPSRRVFMLVGLLVLASAVGVGLLVGDSTDETAPRPNAEDAAAQLQSLDGFSATRRTVIDRENGTSRTLDRVTRRIGEGIRIERVSGPGSVDLIVANESVRWHYDREVGVATRYERSTDPAPMQRIPQLLARVNGSSDGTGPTRTPGISPLPVVPAAGAPATDGPVGAAKGSYEVSYEGTATVADRRAFVVRITGPAGTGPVANYTQTLWLDAEHYVPLKRQTAWTQGGSRTTITTTYENVSFETDLSAATFRFSPPENATVERNGGPQQERYESVGDLRAAASLSVPVPDLPPDYALARATRTDGRRITSVGLRYVNATATVEVAAIEPVYAPTSEGQRVTVAGRNATYRDLGAEQTVVWTCDGTQYKITTSGLGRAGTLAIAATVECG
jgi:outer membrane lipoprotein-sorting protein